MSTAPSHLSNKSGILWRIAKALLRRQGYIYDGALDRFVPTGEASPELAGTSFEKMPY